MTVLGTCARDGCDDDAVAVVIDGHGEEPACAGCATVIAWGRPPDGDPVVTVVPTVMDGTVVRWRLFTNGNPVVSASRNRVEVYPHHGPARREWVEVAVEAHRTLAAHRSCGSAPVAHLATHEHRGLFGPLVPIERRAS